MRRRLLLAAVGGVLTPLAFVLPSARAATAPSAKACIHIVIVVNGTAHDVQIPPGCAG